MTLPLRHDDIIRQQAAEKDLDPALIAAVIYAESRFRDEQQSHAGARGLMQVTPETARAIAEQSGGTEFVVSDLDSAQINISYGSYHLRDLLDTYDGNLVAALAAYNAGSGNVDDWGGAGAGARGHPLPGDPRVRRAGLGEARGVSGQLRGGPGDLTAEREPMPGARAALALGVGLVLADSSVVVLALPEIYRELDVSVSAVVWVLIAFNLVLAAAAVPAAHLAGVAGPARLTVAGLVVFAVASLACGVAPSIEVLIGARCLQAVGGAAAVCASLELMPAVYGSERAAARAWAAAGAAGAALGPGLGGLLTELISWQAIFLFQIPAAAAVVVPLLGIARAERGEWPCDRCARPSACGGLHGAGPGLRRARRGAVPGRPAPDRGLAADPDRRRRGGHRAADLRPRCRPAGDGGCRRSKPAPPRG